MRWVVFIPLSTIDQIVLEGCSQLSPLVEPVEDGIFIDLTGCGERETVLGSLAVCLQGAAQRPVCIGSSRSKMLARIAAAWPYLKQRPPYCRVQSVAGLKIVEPEAGRERDFLGQLCLEDFPVLKAAEVKRLKRAGFTRVEELQGFSPRQLARLLGGHEFFRLERALEACDDEIVLGLYPPERLFYRRIFEFNIKDRIQLGQWLQNAARTLGDCLEERHVAAGRVVLRLWTSCGPLEAERRLQKGCAGSGRLEILLGGLLEHIELRKAVSSLDICLEGLETVRFEQPDLFFAQSLQVEPAWREQTVEDSLEKLLERFPEAVSRGLELDRREQILAFWDPWRFGPEAAKVGEA